ncbi:MAG: ferredoxin [Candidatus Micrarchaeia archaeon]
MIKIIHERNICIGCGACNAVCPKNWKMNDDGKASPIKTEIDEIECNKDAASSCPVNCIHIEQDGKKLI